MAASCGAGLLGLASCRLRAEALARQLHAKLWGDPRRRGSPGDSGCVSPCFGLPALQGAVVDRPPVKIDPHWSMSSLDDDEELLVDHPGGEERLSSPPHLVSPPYFEKMGLKLTDDGISGDGWRPDSPPESDVQSDSPALTTATASPVRAGSPLAPDELLIRLRLIESTLRPPDGPRLVRSTSLKTGQTPPGTPGRKKMVRFADVLGLDLEAVRHFTSGLPPDLPPATPLQPPPPREACRLVPQFEQPAANPRFLEGVRRGKVRLENAVADPAGWTVSGVVRVLNLGFEKRVQVRWTTSEWARHEDLEGEYVPSSCDGFSDRFRFRLQAGAAALRPGRRLQFALRYVANGQEFWDNNSGENYVLEAVRSEPPEEPATACERWLHHFM